MKNNVISFSLFSDQDVFLFREGTHCRLYEKFGSHPTEVEGEKGVYFAVWAPSAKEVNVFGDFNGWNKNSHPLNVRWDSSGIWEGFIPGLKAGEIYKYAVTTQKDDILEKGDPFAFYWEEPPRTGSVIANPKLNWKDRKWIKTGRKAAQNHQSPISIYEVHIGSWRRNPEQEYRSLTYIELATELVDYVKDMGFTHVEFMPVMEHPFYGSWGYQIHGYFAPSARYGTASDFMFLVDRFHAAGIGVILDWVPSHFPYDAHGLYQFDGSSLYEHEDPRLGFHPDWKSYIFNYGRNEIRSFLISNAVFWMDKYHADGLRVDAVASMLYLDYSREEGEWLPNKFGGNENLDAIEFLKKLNETVYREFPECMMIAEESTSFPMVTQPTYNGGLGFGYKWMMGWMNDTLEFFKRDTYFRKFHHNEISFSLTYAFSENFILPLSHDEVVHGKSSIIGRMPGDEWQRFANLRLLYAYMFTHPGGKLLFMGNEFAQTSEWAHDESLHWDLLQYSLHGGVQKLVKDLNNIYKSEESLHKLNYSPNGFEWIDYNDSENGVLAFIRKDDKPKNNLLVVCNFTPQTLSEYKLGVTGKGKWIEILNTDNNIYGGSGFINPELLHAKKDLMHKQHHSIIINLPPLGVTILKKIEE